MFSYPCHIRMAEEEAQKDAAMERVSESPRKNGLEGMEETVPHAETEKVDAVRPGALPGQPAP